MNVTTSSGLATTLIVVLAAPLGAMQSRPSYQEMDISHGATLTGAVTFTGRAPQATQLLITRDVEVCGVGFRERKQVVLTPEGGLQGVVVVIEGIQAGKPWATVAGDYQIDQVDCAFQPHVQAVRWGADFDIINSDPVLHNIHGYELIGDTRRTLFNIGQPPERRTITQTLRPRRGNQIRFECDAHDFMLGWVFAIHTPYAVVVDDRGRFTIDAIPPGRYTVRAWHPYLGVQEQELVVTADGTHDITFAFSRN